MVSMNPPAALRALFEGAADDAPEFEALLASWRRSAVQHHIDPLANVAPRILTQYELLDQREPLADLVAGSAAEMDRLYGLVRAAGYVVLLCDTNGVTVDHRGDDLKSKEFRHWGIWLGGVWSEAIEGTNGIGTCIAEQRPVTVHRRQHFRARHTDLSCSGAPIFDVDGRLLAVLDVSSYDPSCSDHAHALTGALVQAHARAIEERRFRKIFARDWVIALALPDAEKQSALLAVDADRRIIAADRAARAEFGLNDRLLADGIGLSSVFDHAPLPTRGKAASDVPLRLTAQREGVNYPALAAAPAGHSSGVSAPLQKRAVSGSPRGGLSKRTLHRVEDYLNANLSGSIDLTQLAEVAGMSKFHFARQFKHSTGMTPRRYLMRRRIERAKQLLADTELKLTEIAVATGFADQSHFARQFRQAIGMTPGRYRDRGR